MAFYQNATQLYECFQELLQRIGEVNPDAEKPLIKSRIAVRFNCTEPPAEIFINARKKPVEISYGTSKVRPDLDITLSTDTLHGILLGNISLRQSAANKSLRVKGPVHKTFALINIFTLGQDLYPQILADKGLSTE